MRVILQKFEQVGIKIVRNCYLCGVFRKRHKTYLLNFPTELAPQKRKKSNLYLYWSMRNKAQIPP